MKKLILLFLLIPTLLKAQIIDVSSMQQPAGSTPTINVNVTTFPQFTANQGSPSTSQPGTLSGVNLTANIVFAALTGYEYSKDNTTFTSTISYTPSSGTVASTTFYIRMASTATGTPSGNVVISSTGASSRQISVTGLVSSTSPTINLSTGSLTTFNYVTGTPPASQSWTVSASNLTANVGITAPTGFEISGDNNTFQGSLTLTRSGSILSGQPLTIYGRGKASNSPGSLSGNITHSTTGGTDQLIAVNATVTSGSSSVAKWNFSQASSPVTGWNNVTGADGSTVKSYTDASTGWTLQMVGANQQGFFGTQFAQDGQGAASSTDALFPVGVLANFYIQAAKPFDPGSSLATANYMAKIANLPAGTYKIYVSGSVKSTWNNGMTTPEWRAASESSPVTTGGANDMQNSLNLQNNTTSHLTFTIIIAAGNTLYVSMNTPSSNDPGAGGWGGIIVEKQ